MAKRIAKDGWPKAREVILMVVGILIVIGEYVSADIRGGDFHKEWLILGAAFCGLSITQWTDRR